MTAAGWQCYILRETMQKQSLYQNPYIYILYIVYVYTLYTDRRFGSVKRYGCGNERVKPIMNLYNTVVVLYFAQNSIFIMGDVKSVVN
jgi:hypothetical protein